VGGGGPQAPLPQYPPEIVPRTLVLWRLKSRRFTKLDFSLQYTLRYTSIEFRSFEPRRGVRGVGEHDEEAVGPGTVVSDVFAEERFYR